MKTRNRTPAERAIIYAAVMGELSLEETRELLKSAGFGHMPESSWDMLKRKYLPEFRKNPRLIGECIHKPKSMGDIGETHETQTE